MEVLSGKVGIGISSKKSKKEKLINNISIGNEHIFTGGRIEVALGPGVLVAEMTTDKDGLEEVIAGLAFNGESCPIPMIMKFKVDRSRPETFPNIGLIISSLLFGLSKAVVELSNGKPLVEVEAEQFVVGSDGGYEQ